MDKKSSQWQQLQNLKEIYEAGFITVEEFTLRKKQLVDQLTGTTTSSDAYSTRESVRKYSEGDCSSATALTYVVAVSLSVSTGPTVVKHSPDKVFEGIDPERAVKYTFDLKAKEWITKESLVKIDEVPFAKGGLRYVHYLTDLEEKQLMVAKISADARDKERKDIYLQDVFMQTFAKEYAMKFNTYNPPKKVDFVNAFLLELIDRPGSPLCAVERYIEGEYRKHNNNFGYVSEEERNTPQAFSHFTYEASQHTLLICDIQGVSDLYTDPQIHTSEHHRVGKGDLGRRGIERFLETHKCNPICRYLKLPPINADYKTDVGTVPTTAIMPYTQVDYVDVTETSLSQLPLLPARPHKSTFCCCVIL